MRGIWIWVREGLLRLLGSLSQVSFTLRRVHTPLTIVVPAVRVHELVPVRVYFGWRPRWGLLVRYREEDQESTPRQLSLSFSDPRERRAAYAVLASAAGIYGPFDKRR